MDNKDNAGNSLVTSSNTSNEIETQEIDTQELENPVHQFENLQPVVETNYNRYKKLGIMTIVILFAIIVISFIVSSLIKSSHNKVCIPIEDSVTDAAFKYAKEKDLLPKNDGESIVVSLDTLYKNDKLTRTETSVKKSICYGDVKITKYKKDYIKTINLTSCNYCASDKRYGKWSKETTKKPSGKNMIVDVTAYYNYYTYEDYNSNWTNYFRSDLINKEVSDKYQVALPIDQTRLPKIPNEAKILKIEKEDKNYYRYRDQKWKFYIEQGGNYTNYFASEPPKGYPNKDDATAKFTKWSDWSLDYPEVKNYRVINSAYGYKWYYLKGKEKVYWNGGAYSVEQPSEKYNIKDKERGSEKMYHYRDKTWRWYNGNKRKYSTYHSFAPKGYTHKDNDLTKYTSWTSWRDISYVNDNNRGYREQEVDVYSRYRINYRMTSYMKLDNYLTLKDFEKETNSSLEEILKQEKTDIDIIYKFKYRKR